MGNCVGRVTSASDPAGSSAVSTATNTTVSSWDDNVVQCHVHHFVRNNEALPLPKLDTASYSGGVVEVNHVVEMVVDVPKLLYAPSQLLDGFMELGLSRAAIRLPPSIDVHVARLYFDFVTALKVPPMPSTKRELMNIREKWREVDDFFGGSVKDFPMNDWMHELFAASPTLGQTACLDLIRRDSVFARDRLEADPYRFLIKAAIVPIRSITFCSSMYKLPNPVNVEHAAFIDMPDVVQNVPSWSAACIECDRLLQLRLPWYGNSQDTKCGVVVAGGKLVAALYDKHIKGQDVDMFIIAHNASEALSIANATIDAIKERHMFGDVRVEVNHKELVTDVLVFEQDPDADKFRLLHKYQIIRTAFPSPSHVVHGFDVDVCGILFDGHELYCTYNAARAIVNGFNLYDQNKLSTSAEHRYAKYLTNYGIDILVAGMPQSSVVQPLLMMRHRGYEWWEKCSTDPPILQMVYSGRQEGSTHDIAGILYHIMLIKNRNSIMYPRRQVVTSNYDGPVPEFALHNMQHLQRSLTESDFRIAAQDAAIFTGGFNPVKADTLARVDMFQ